MCTAVIQMTCRLGLICLTLLSYYDHRVPLVVDGQLLSTGKEFVFCFPKMAEDSANSIVFYLHTPGKKDFKVTITSEGYETGERMNEEVTLTSGELSVFALPSEYFYLGGIGLKITFKLSGTESFGVTVMMKEGPSSVATLLGIPVESWGKVYYAVTLGSNPFINIINGQHSVRVVVRLRITAVHETPNVNIAFNGETYGNHEQMIIILDRYQAFEISDCRANNSQGSLSGSKITSQRPVGVISGSCNINRFAACVSKKKTADFSADMLFPHDTFGKEFITPTINGRFDSGSFTFISIRSSTPVNYLSPTGASQQLRLAKEGEPKTVSLTQVYSWMKSIDPVQIYYTKESPCSSENDPSDISLTYLVPVHLYYHIYVFSVPNIQDAAHFVFTSTKVPQAPHMTLDGQSLATAVKWDRIKVYRDYEAGSFSIGEGVHEIANKQKASFGCHLFGHGPRFSYSHSVGLMSLYINQECEPFQEQMKPADMIDNDCDGRVDEEVKDGKDDDKDYKIDEDLNDKEVTAAPVVTRKPATPAPKPSDNVSGYFEDWEDWHCTDNCSDLRLTRQRKCYHPDPTRIPVCRGITVEYRPGICYFNVPCPTECPSYTWGVGCRLNCINCKYPCDKFNGSCSECNAGFKNPRGGCRHACGKFSYGLNCDGDCEEKCGVDCVDRVTGQCPTTKIYLLPVLVLVLLIPCCNLICSGKYKADMVHMVATKKTIQIDTLKTYQEEKISKKN